MSDNKRRIPIFLGSSTADAIEEVADQFSLSRSKIIRDLVGQQLDDEEELSDAVIDAIPERTLKLAERERQEEALKEEQKLIEKKASFEDRVRGYFRKRLEGNAAYSPDLMEELAEGYKRDAQIWFDDPEEIEQREELVDDWMLSYRLAYFARQHSDEIDTEMDSDEIGSWFSVGEDIQKLRSRLEEVIDHVRSIAEQDGVGWDDDAVIDSVAGRWSVSEGAVLLLLEHLVSKDDGSVAEMLRLGGDHIEIPTGLDQLGAGNGSRSVPIEELPDDAEFVSRDPDARSAVETDGGEP